MKKKEILKSLKTLLKKIKPIPQDMEKKIEKINYITSGFLDSMEIIKFNLNIENKFKISFRPSDKSKKNFMTLEGLVEIIFKKLVNKT